MMNNTESNIPKQRIADCHIHTRFLDYTTTSKMLRDIKETGVSDACILSLPYRSCAENLFGIFVKHFYEDVRVRSFGGLHVTDRYAKIPPEEQVRALLSLGCDGIKLMFSPDLRKYYGRGIDDPYYDPMLSYLEEHSVPVNIHLADPEHYWDKGWPHASADLPSKESIYEEGLRMLDKHPGLRVCFAHFMFLSNYPDEAERVMERYPNIWLDLTPGMEMYYCFDKNYERWREFFEKYSHRILFGTDCNSIKSCNKALESLVYRKLTEKGEFSEFCYGKSYTVRGFSLSEKTVLRICRENYFSFLGNEAKPVNIQMLRELCQRIIRDISENPIDEYYIRGGSLIPDLLKDPEQKVALNFCEMALSRLNK